MNIDIADDLSGKASRVRKSRLYVVFHQEHELTVADKVEVRLNGEVLTCLNPLVPGSINLPVDSHNTPRQIYELKDNLPRCGNNEISLRLIEPNKRFRQEVPLEVTDIELEIDYDYPNGPWVEPQEYLPVT